MYKVNSLCVIMINFDQRLHVFQTSHLQNLVVVVQPVEWFISLIAYSVYQANCTRRLTALILWLCLKHYIYLFSYCILDYLRYTHIKPGTEVTIVGLSVSVRSSDLFTQLSLSGFWLVDWWMSDGTQFLIGHWLLENYISIRIIFRIVTDTIYFFVMLCISNDLSLMKKDEVINIDLDRVTSFIALTEPFQVKTKTHKSAILWVFYRT